MRVKLVIISGGKHRQEILVRRPEMLVGRQSGCGLRIPSETVSRHHCRLLFQGDCLTVEDLGSTNGTLLNGVRTAGIQLVQAGDCLAVGPVTFQVEYLPEQEPDPTEANTSRIMVNPVPKAPPTVEAPMVAAPPREVAPVQETAFLDEVGWQLPTAEDMRDILARMKNS